MNQTRLFPQLWYENAAGARWVPDFAACDVPTPPEGFIYQHARFPRQLTDSICTDQGQIMEGHQSWPGDLVLALTRPRWRERLRALLRYGVVGPRVSIDDAIVWAAASCERCMNTLAHRAGLPWGYRRNSVEDTSRTSCDNCWRQN